MSPTKHVVALDNIGLNCIPDGDVPVIRGNVDGDSDMHDDEFIRVSMISVDETRRDTSVNINNSLGDTGMRDSGMCDTAYLGCIWGFSTL